ncbi:MAG: hypothetical protein KatS3mg022_2799 [Armatimonadota bacterium]|nr:MAG: hypothetical protein KatS3mg022_2799 [Armatimonadota bacterium]
MAKMNQCTYGIAQIHLTPEARMFVSLPRSSTFILPVRFASDSQNSWSLIIVPEKSLKACQWTRAKVGLLAYEQGAKYIREGAEFTIEYTTQMAATIEIGQGIVVGVENCSADEYRQIFRYPNPD